MHKPIPFPLTLPMSDFFGWKHHPFADTTMSATTWLPERDERILETVKRLLHTGKSTALCGSSGSGKTTLAHALIADLDKNAYRPVFIPYVGHSRIGMARILADALGVTATGRGLPLITRVKQHVENLSAGSNPRHPVIIIDDAQQMESESFWDLCSLTSQTTRQASAASLILVGDELLAKRLSLHVLTSIRNRLTCIMKLMAMNEHETCRFIESRLKNAQAPQSLFDKDALEIIVAHTRGNRRAIMNAATMAIEEAYFNQEKTITAERLYSSEWFNESG